MILALEHTAAALQLKEPLDPSQHEHIPRVGVKDPEVVVRVAHPPGPPTALLEHLCGRQRPEAEGCVHKSDLELVVAFTAEFRFQGRLEWPQLHLQGQPELRERSRGERATMAAEGERKGGARY